MYTMHKMLMVKTQGCMLEDIVTKKLRFAYVYIYIIFLRIASLYWYEYVMERILWWWEL